jgi:non-canonical poly(A) RNA polymerase PAPD5/7
MGDHYQPPPYRNGRDGRYRDDNRANGGYRQRDEYNGQRDGYRQHDEYRPRDEYPDYDYDYRDRDYDRRQRPYQDNYPYQDSYSRGEAPYAFHGAAEGHTQSYRPQEQFTFQASGPRFPADQYPPPHPQEAGARRRADPRPGQGRRGGRGGFSQRGRGGAPRLAPHSRDILQRAGREPTPEQLEGMNVDGHARFKDVDSGSEVDSAEEDDEMDAPPAKRTKADPVSTQDVPKWSNPDPYTALPPPETLGAPKKDIVQVIRKAKVEAAKSAAASAVRENVDFISLNFDDDVSGEVASEVTGIELASKSSGSADVNGYSHREQLHMTEAPVQSIEPRDERARPAASSNKQKKRKRDDTDTTIDATILPMWQARGDPTPWCKFGYLTGREGLDRLNAEIRAFYEFVRPYPQEEAVRNDLIFRIQYAVTNSGVRGAATAQVKCFGSFAAGVYLPTADMDLVLVSPEFLNTGRKVVGRNGFEMRNLANSLKGRGLVGPRNYDVITRARVPIIKFQDPLTDLRVDLSFENDSGIHAIGTVQGWKGLFPAMPVLVVLIKQLLAMRDLNEVFSGGIGGFTIICLVVSLLQNHHELQSADVSYGDLLLRFLDFYGNKFNYQSRGIMMNPPGYFDKQREGRGQADKLTIIDPNRFENDISVGSSRVQTVFNVFSKAHEELTRKLEHNSLGPNDDGSILGCMWGGRYDTFIQQREKLSEAYKARFPGQQIKTQSQSFVQPVEQTHMHPLPPRPSTSIAPVGQPSGYVPYHPQWPQSLFGPTLLISLSWSALGVTGALT